MFCFGKFSTNVTGPIIMTTKAVNVVLVVGKTKIPVSLSTSESQLDDDHLTVNHICEAVHQHARIRPESQKLIYRGRTLFKTFDPNDDNLRKSLSSLGLKAGDRIMVFGKPDKEVKENDRSNDLMKVLDQHQAKIEEICVLCKDMVQKNGNNPGTVEDLKKHKKFFIGQSEYSMQALTHLDATPGDASQCREYKTRRKALVNTLLENVAMCDNQVSLLTSSIQEWENSQCPNSKEWKP